MRAHRSEAGIPAARPRGRRLPVLLLLLLVALLAGCGDGSGARSGESDSTLQELDGRTFVVTDLDDDTQEIVPGSTIQLTFAGGTIGAHAGCNSMSGAVSVERGRLRVESLAGTEMACAPPLMEQETWVGAFLAEAPTVELAGAVLTLATADTILHLEEEVVVDSPLEGTAWRLESLMDGSGPDGTVGTPPRRAATATLSIEGGRLTVDTGCNTVSAPVEHADGELRAGDLTTTLRDCGRASRALERRFRQVLRPPTMYELDGATLTLWSADGLRGLGFRAG